MNRIKYRVWDIYKKKFVTDYVGIRPDGNIVIYNIWYDDSDESIYQDESWTDIDDKNQFIIQQFTGVKDFAGKEIYEGDIVKIFNQGGFLCNNKKESDVWYEVKWEKLGFRFNLINGIFAIGCGVSSVKPIEYQIIGNIFENPELINE